jgi:pseudaminic acid cytidylyltransferase
VSRVDLEPTLAIITARGGSKRIPRKNIKPFLQKPMIAWAIETATQSNLFSEVMVSTDDEEIAEISKSFGAKIPFYRSPKNADDHSTTSDVLSEVLSMYEAKGQTFTYACCIYPTAILVTSNDLCLGLETLRQNDFDVIMPVCEFSYPIWRSLKRHPDTKIELNFPENLNTRSQDLPPTYHDAGQWYWFKTKRFLTSKRLLGDNTGSLLIPSYRVQDIDSEDDWLLAEIKYKRLIHYGS